jgi:5'-nucleotidase
MKILVVNDDSIHSPGIALLAKAAMEFGEVTVVAPAYQCSAMSHKISIHDAMKVEKVEDFPVPVKAAYKVGGTPADCVKVALHYILGEKPDYVFSGINEGYNVGYDIAYSGTLGAAFEAVMNGIPAMAFSNTMNAPLHIAEAYLVPVIQELMEAGQGRGEVWNVNFPAVEPDELKGILRDRQIAPMQFYSENYVQTKNKDGSVSLKAMGTPLTAEDMVPAGTDVEAVVNGYISIGKVKSVVL